MCARIASQGRARVGFTLVELLVVIVIVGVLMALLFSVANRAREKAKEVQCISNLRQAGRALLARSVEHGNHLEAQVSGSGSPSTLRWPNQVAEYLLPGWSYAKNYRDRNVALDVLFCPSYPPHYQDPKVVWDWACYGLYSEDTSYAQKRKIDESYWVYWLPLAAVPAPGRHPLLLDSVYASAKEQRMTMNITAGPSKGCVHLRHSGRAHVVFLDGHVETTGPKELKELGFISGYSKDLEVITF